MTEKVTAKYLQKILPVDKVSKYKGKFTARLGYFYRHGMDENKLSEKISKVLIEKGISFIITDCGDHFARFDGSAPVEKSSHFFVEFSVIEE